MPITSPTIFLRLASRSRGLVLMLCALLALTACQGNEPASEGDEPNAGNDSADSSGGETEGDEGNEGSDQPLLNTDPVWLNTRYQKGQRVRTVRELYSTEVVQTGHKMITESRESYVQTIKSIDNLGQPFHVERYYEESWVSVRQPGGEAQVERSGREGSEIELIQTERGVTAKLLSGNASADELGDLLITGFDSALLPTQPVRVGQSWTVDVNATPGLRGISKAFGLHAEKNELSAKLYASNDRESKIALNWNVRGKIKNSTPLVIRLAGEMVLDHDSGLITLLDLAGGKTDNEGKVIPQIALRITREEVRAWYD